MARITADSVIDDQLDTLYGDILRLDGIHLRLQGEDHGLCRECGTRFPCPTSQIVQEMKKAFVARRGPHPTDVEERSAKDWCYQDPTTREWVHAPFLHRGCILR